MGCVAWLLGCLVAWLLGCLVAWLLGCLVAWLLGCWVAGLRGYEVARLRGCEVAGVAELLSTSCAATLSVPNDRVHPQRRTSQPRNRATSKPVTSNPGPTPPPNRAHHPLRRRRPPLRQQAAGHRRPARLRSCGAGAARPCHGARGPPLSDAAARPRDEWSDVLLQTRRHQREAHAAVRDEADPEALSGAGGGRTARGADDRCAAGANRADLLRRTRRRQAGHHRRRAAESGDG